MLSDATDLQTDEERAGLRQTKFSNDALTLYRLDILSMSGVTSDKGKAGMGEIAPLHDPQDRPRVLRRIQRLWKEGSVEIVQHAQERMAERDLDIHDIYRIIESGRITEISRPHAQWRYKISGKSVEGKRAACVVEIDGRLIIITVVDLSGPRTKRGGPS